MSLPMDVAAGKSKIAAFPSGAFKAAPYGSSPLADIKRVASLIDNAKLPVLFLGQRASSTQVVGAVRTLLAKHKIAGKFRNVCRVTHYLNLPLSGGDFPSSRRRPRRACR